MNIKIRHEQIDFPGQSTLKINYAKRPYFLHPWHFHEEFQITYVIKSSGTRFVGDQAEPFGPGDLVMLAGNLPHYWRSDEIYYTGNPEIFVHRLTIQFPGDFFKNVFSTYPEFSSIKHLIQQSERGMKFNPPESEKLGKMLLKLVKIRGFRQVMHFLEILQLMSNSQNTQLLASEKYQPGRNELTDDRLKKIMRFLSSNYFREISFSEIADIAGLHPVSLCRYFKEKTGKKISVYLNELRIGFACKLLLEGTLQVSQICFEVGFNNISNFNRNFRRITGMTPKHYKTEFFK
jgi:AraC-like DNA-binding protein